MSPEDLAQALLEAQDTAGRQSLLVARDEAFYVTVLSLLKDQVDRERLRNPAAALHIAEIGVEVAGHLGFPRCRALAAWAYGNVLIHRGDYAECLHLYREAARFFAAEGAEIEAARLTANQAFVLKNLGRYDEGLQAAQAALAILQRHPPSIFTASALNGLGVLYRLLRRDHDALAAFAEGEQIYASLGDAVMQARMMINKANVFENIDRFGEALDLLQQARAVLADHGRSLEVARADLNLGVTYTRLGRYDEALEALSRAEEGFINLDNPMEAAVVVLYRADLYASFNLYDELLQASVRDWQLFDERQMQWQAARATLHKAVAWRRLGAGAQAEEMLQEARTIFERIGDPVWVRMVDLERVAIWCEMEEWARALPQAAEISAFFDDRSMPVRAAAGSLLAAQCHLALGGSIEAARHYQRVFGVAQQLDVPWLLYRAYYGLGQVAEKQGDWQTACERFRQAVETIEWMRQRLRVEEFRLGFLEDKLQVYRDTVLLCLKMGREPEAFAYVERAKSGALVDLLIASLGRQLAADNEANSSLVARLTAFREQLNWHYSKLQGGGQGERGQDWHLPEVEIWERISAVEQQAVRAWRDLQQASPFYASLGPLPAFVPDVLHVDLHKDQVLIEYYVSGETILAFVVGRDGLRVCLSLACALSQIDDTLVGLDTTLRNASRFDPGYVTNTLAPLCRQQLGWLYDDLLRPLEPFIAGAQRLLVAPDGVLFAVPFHILHDGARFVLEQYEIAYVPSAGTLQLCQENQRRTTSAPQALVVGYSAGNSLPHVRQEVDAVARVLPEVTVFADERASLPALLAHASQCTLLHLATHAVFRRDNPLFSALQLAGGDWLRVMDLYTLRLNGALVTLSGCETGRHRLLGGDLLGLSRGFFYAGAAALVVSLWPVDDVSTAILMEHFYTHLVAGETAASALRLAQLAVRNWQEERNGRSVRPYAHPYYWASFCLLGAPDVRLG